MGTSALASVVPAEIQARLDHEYFTDRGVIVEHGGPATFFKEAKDPRSKEFLSQILRRRDPLFAVCDRVVMHAGNAAAERTCVTCGKMGLAGFSSAAAQAACACAACAFSRELPVPGSL